MHHGADLFFRLRGLGPLEQVDVVGTTLLFNPVPDHLGANGVSSWR
jgi:hypothetical protein